MNPIALGVLIVLGLSILGNVALFRMHSSDQQKIASEHAAYLQSQAAGQQCSDATDKLSKDAAARELAAGIAIRAAQGKARLATSKAQSTLATAPTQPGDLCSSADVLNRAKIAERRK